MPDGDYDDDSDNGDGEDDVDDDKSECDGLVADVLSLENVKL